MAALPSEMFSKLVAERDALREHRDQIMEMLKWNTAIVSVLLQEAGGLVEIPKETLEGIDLTKTQTLVTPDEERGVYIIEGVFEDESG